MNINKARGRKKDHAIVRVTLPWWKPVQRALHRATSAVLFTPPVSE